MRYTTILFDLDGTLTDSQTGITQTICRVLADFGQPSHEPQSLTWCVGPPLVESLAQLLGDEEQAARALLRYEDYYRGGGMFINRVYEGVPQTLESLLQAGYELGVVTGKPLDQACPILEHFGLRRFFRHVYGPTPEHRSENKVLLLAAALADLGHAPESCLYVGDRRGDALGAQANGIPILGAGYGYGGIDELRGAGVDVVAASPADWLPKIRQLEKQSS